MKSSDSQQHGLQQETWISMYWTMQSTEETLSPVLGNRASPVAEQGLIQFYQSSMFLFNTKHYTFDRTLTFFPVKASAKLLHLLRAAQSLLSNICYCSSPVHYSLSWHAQHKARLQTLTNAALPAWGHTASWRHRGTESAFWLLAGDGSRVPCSAASLELQMREEPQLHNCPAPIWLEESLLGWIPGFEITQQKAAMKAGSTMWNMQSKHLLLVPLISCSIKSAWTEFPIVLLF